MENLYVTSLFNYIPPTVIGPMSKSSNYSFMDYLVVELDLLRFNILTTLFASKLLSSQSLKV